MSISAPRFGSISALAFFVALPFVAAVTLAGCAAPVLDPSAPAPDGPACTQLAKDIGGLRMARAQAQAKQRDPWTFVIPFAVEGRHVASPNAVQDADRSIAAMDVQAQLLGCPLPERDGKNSPGMLS